MGDKPYGLSGKALLRKDDRYLVIRRSSESRFWPGEWDLCGGKTDPGESFDMALIREAQEEAGVHVRLLSFVGASEYELPHVKVVFLVMEAEVIGGEVQLSEEHEEHRWVTSGELKDLHFAEPIADALRAGGRI